MNEAVWRKATDNPKTSDERSGLEEVGSLLALSDLDPNTDNSEYSYGADSSIKSEYSTPTDLRFAKETIKADLSYKLFDGPKTPEQGFTLALKDPLAGNTSEMINGDGAGKITENWNTSDDSRGSEEMCSLLPPSDSDNANPEGSHDPVLPIKSESS
jgi:hypothetical protein